MSVHDPAKFQQYSVISAKSAADTKNRMFFRYGALFMADTVAMHTTYSVHTGILKPWRSRLPWLPAVFSFYHVFSLPLSGLNWRSLFPPWGSEPSLPQNGAPIHRVRAHSLTGIRNNTFSQCTDVPWKLSNFQFLYLLHWLSWSASAETWEYKIYPGSSVSNFFFF
jgi:hypothetical protein